MAFKSQRFDPAYLHQKQTVKPRLCGLFFIKANEESDTWRKRPWVDFESEREVHPGPFFVLFSLVVMAALPEMPVTDSLEDVRRFIRAVKSDHYFMEAASWIRNK